MYPPAVYKKSVFLKEIMVIAKALPTQSDLYFQMTKYKHFFCVQNF